MTRVLFLLQLPPPIHGASVVNKTIMDSTVINSTFETKFINISPASATSILGKVSIRKILTTSLICFRTIYAFLRFNPKLVYLTLSPTGPAFYKDGILAILVKMLGGRLVFHMHGKGIESEAKESKFKMKLYRFVFNNVDVIHLSESLYYDVEAVRDKTRKLIAIPNSVPEPPSMFENKNVEFENKNADVVTFVYISNLARSKGADVLVKAACLLPEKMQNKFRVKIIGRTIDPEYVEEIHQLIDSNVYQNISFLGPKYGDEKYQELLSSHVFVLPTKYKNECFPLAILEAMSTSLAVIASSEGAIPEIIDPGLTGELIGVVDPENLSNIMINFIEDRDHLIHCSLLSREKYERLYTPGKFESAVCAALNSLA